MSVAIVALRGFTRRTGRFLAHELGADLVSRDSRRPYDIVIRWGNSQSLVHANIEVNSSDAIRAACRKKQALDVLHREGVQVPPFSSLPQVQEDVDFYIPGFLRTSFHQGGKGLAYVRTRQEFDRVACQYSYVIKEIKKVREYRVHVGNWPQVEPLLFVQRKLRQEDADPTSVVWNFRGGWTLNYRELSVVNQRVIENAQRAVQALGLDFGAVDVLEDIGGGAWVVEVNTAPSLKIQSSQHFYLDFFRAIINEYQS